MRGPQPDSDPEQGFLSRVFLRLFLSSCSCSVTELCLFPPCFHLISVCSELCWRDIKVLECFMRSVSFTGLALWISSSDPDVPLKQHECFCCGNCSMEKWDGGLRQRAVCVCCVFVALGPPYPSYSLPIL